MEDPWPIGYWYLWIQEGVTIFLNIIILNFIEIQIISTNTLHLLRPISMNANNSPDFPNFIDLSGPKQYNLRVELLTVVKWVWNLLNWEHPFTHPYTHAHTHTRTHIHTHTRSCASHLYMLGNWGLLLMLNEEKETPLTKFDSESTERKSPHLSLRQVRISLNINKF